MREVWSLAGPACPGGTVLQYIDGQFRDASSGEWFTTADPATERTLARVGVASTADVDIAVKAARRAFEEGPWPRMRASERADYLFEMADLLEAVLTELADLETRDTGLPIRFTEGGHVPKAISHFRHFAEEATRMGGEAYSMDGAYLNVVLREPIGVAAVITPWNAPLAVASMNVAAALASGNTCLLKPSEQAPLSTAVLARVAVEANLPAGVLNILYGPGRPTGEALVVHPGVDAVSFTGGVGTGQTIMATAASGLKRLGFELGGKSANIIFADADIEAAVDGSVLALFANNGEVCMAGSRILVERSCYPSFLEAFVQRARGIRVANPRVHSTELGPLISAAHLDWVTHCIASGLEEGARLACGGGRPDGLSTGYYLQPTVFADVDNAMQIAQREVFGPVAAVLPFDGTEETAVRLANDSRYGLAGYVWTGISEKGLRVARKLRAGTIAINSPMVRDPRVPFGGYKCSGIGRTGGRHSIEMFTELKTTCLPIEPYAFPRLGAG